MYRKRSSILAIKPFSSSFSQVSPPPCSSRSSQNALLNSIKTSHLSCHGRRWSFSVAAQRSDFSPDSDPIGIYQQDASGSDGRNSLNLHQNPNGYQSHDFREVRQWNSDGFCGGESAVESCRRDPFGVDRGSSASLQQNLNGFSRGSLDGRQRCDLAEFRPPNSNDGCQRSNLGEAQHWSASRVGNEHPYKNQSAFSRENQINRNSFRNHTGNSVGSSQQNPRVLPGGSRVRNGYPYNNQSGCFRENQIDQNSIRNRTGNFVESSQQNVRVLSGGSKVGDGYPYENQSGFFRENHIEVHQDPTRHNPDPRRHYSVNPGQLYQNSYDSHRENPLPYENIIESARTSSAKSDNELFAGGSLGTGEMISYEGTLNKLEQFCKEGKLKEAIAVMAVFEKAGMVIDLSKYLNLVQACGEAKSLEEARVVHDYLSRRLGDVEVWVHNKILYMYTKCGSMGDAYQFFEKMPCRNLTSWETMIRGLSDNGLGEEAIDLFTQFKNIGLKPDGALFAAVFYTCGVLGAVDQGLLYYKSMKLEFGIVPVMEHYASIIDMFGRSGYLDEALEFIEAIPIEPNVNVWEILMNFCRVNGYTELGDRCAEIVEQLDSSRLTDQSRMGFVPVNTLEITKEKEMKDNSAIAAGKHQMQQYVAGRPENYMIYEKIRCLAQHMKEAGYVPNAAVTLHDVDLESREEALLYHSERLALVHGLMTSSVEAPIRIIKNLRVCSDCHNALKIISKLTGRLIIARDTKRFHHFQNGVCSCNDFW